jgi:hypothetical protein
LNLAAERTQPRGGPAGHLVRQLACDYSRGHSSWRILMRNITRTYRLSVDKTTPISRLSRGRAPSNLSAGAALWPAAAMQTTSPASSDIR